MKQYTAEEAINLLKGGGATLQITQDGPAISLLIDPFELGAFIKYVENFNVEVREEPLASILKIVNTEPIINQLKLWNM